MGDEDQQPTPPDESAAGLTACQACGAENRPEAKFCGSCGVALAAELVCASCGAEVPSPQAFCDQCGAPLRGRAPDGATEAPPAPGPPVLPTGERPVAPGAAPSTGPESIGDGRYRFVRFLGEGATKRVFVARDVKLQREVAVSVIPLGDLDDTEVARVRREVEAMAGLGASRHVVTVHDIGEEDGELYAVSEYMSGGDLAELLDQAEDRRLPVAEAVRIAGELAETLEDVHAQGIVHRDIKPQNVWLASDGTVKLGDFGLAVDRGRSRLTVEGLMVGTVAYMPPEQALGRSAEARSDIYSLGAVLYEMLCGAPPFAGDDASAVISQHLSTPPVGPRTHRAEVPAQLDRLVVEMLAKRADERPQGASEVRQALKTIGSALDDRTISPTAEGLQALTDLGFVGRERELGSLRAAADAAISGRGSIVAVAGEPGIGKTRLVSEAASYADLRGANVVWGRCLDDPGAPPYWPWVQVVRSFVQERDEDSLLADLGSGAGDIASIVSEIRARFPDLTEPPTLDPEQARFRLFDSVSTFVVNAATRQPLAIILDDLHVADRPSLLLLQFLAARLADAPVLLLCTYRDDELEGNDELSETLGILSQARGYQRIRLRALTEPEVKALLENVSQQHLEGRDQLALLRAVHGESEGNPFFIEEILRHLVDSGRIYRTDDGVWTSDVTTIRDLGIPKGIRDAIDRRLERLDEGAREVLEVASVLGREFGLEHLVIVTGAEREVVANRLDEAAGGDIVASVEGEADRFRFAHAAVRDTLYEELSPGRRVELHRRAGEALEELHADQIESHLGELTHHFVEAAPGGEPEKAADYAWWAGERASAQHAYEDAAHHFEQALGLFESRRDEPVPRCELLLGLGDARWRSGDIGGAKETFLRAAELARESSLDDALARAALGYGGGVGGFGASDRVDHTLVDLLRGALRVLPDRDSQMRVRATGRLAVELANDDSARTERLELAEGAVEMAERIGDPRVQLLALYSRQWSALGPDDVDGQLRGADEILRLASAVGDREMEFRARHFRLGFLMQVGDIESADRELKACAKLSDELRQPHYEWQVGVFRAMRALREGRFAEGERLAQSAFAIGQSGFPDLATISFGAQLQQIRWATGGLEELLAGGEALANQYPDSAWPAALVFLYAEAGEESRARAQMDKVAAGGFTIRRDRDWMIALASLLSASDTLDDAERAATLYPQFEPFADQYTVVLSGAGLIGSNHLYLGLGARCAGRLDDAIEHLERALERNRRIGERLMTPRVHHALARALIERGGDGDRERAEEQIETGLAVAQAHGMQPHVEELMALKLEVEGVGPIAVETSIDVVASSVQQARPDLRSATAPDGTVTILFSDIVDSTVLTEQLGDQRWLELLRRHNEMVRSAVATHAGYEVKSQGDGFMLAFASARKAVACAIEIQEAMADHTRANPSEPLRLRIGVHTGEALRDQEDFFGKSVILAARIAARAGAGEILVSSLLRELVSSGGDFSFGDERELELKGLSGRYRVSDVAWSAEGLPAATGVPLPAGLEQGANGRIVGRKDEIALLAELRGRAFEDRLGVALIAGEPGVGKTALATRTALDAHAEGAVVLHGRCDEEAGSPYQPWVQALGHYVQAGPDAVLAAHVERHGGELARLVPSLSDRLPSALPPPSSGDPEADRSLAFNAVTDLVATASAETPIVIVFEDLHRADASTLALLRHVVEFAAEARILLIATYRSVELTPEHPGAEAFQELRAFEPVQPLDIAGLSEKDVVALMRGSSSEELQPDARRLASEIHRETDGNPFFVTELLRHLSETGGVVREADGRCVIGEAMDLELPPSVRELVEQRVAQLGSPAGEALAAAAVLGREFELEALVRVAGLDEDELRRLLDRAIDASLLGRLPEHPDRYRFAHALVTHTLYQQLGAERRARLHRLAGEALEELYGSDPGPRAGELAHHWTNSGGADAGRAVRYSVVAGRHALTDLAPDEALRWFSRALGLVERQEHPDLALRCDVLIGMGDAQRQTGDRRYRATLLEACGLARELADGGRLARAALANTRGWTSTAGKVDEERVAAIQDALELLEDGREPARARLLAQLSLERAYDRDLPRRRALSDEALSLARGGDARTLAYVLGRRYLTIWAPETLAERAETASEFAAVAERLDGPIARYGAASWQFLASLEAGEVEAADDALERKAALAERIGRPVMRWEALFQRSARAYLAGRLDEAEALAGEAVQVGRDQPDAATIYAAQIVAVRYDQGRLNEFADLFADAAARNEGLSTFQAALALMYCELDRHEDARRALASGADSGFSNVPHDNLWLTTMAAYADTCAQLGEVDAAGALFPQIEPYGDRLATNGVNANGSMARLLGLLAATIGRFDDADRHFAAACATHERIGAPIFLARTRYEWAKALLAAGRDGDALRARDLLDQALECARRHGCAVLQRRAEAARAATDAVIAA